MAASRHCSIQRRFSAAVVAIFMLPNLPLPPAQVSHKLPSTPFTQIISDFLGSATVPVSPVGNSPTESSLQPTTSIFHSALPLQPSALSLYHL